jgi:hypothetical protein
MLSSLERPFWQALPFSLVQPSWQELFEQLTSWQEQAS